MGILAKDGVVMASERKITSGLLAPARVRCTQCFSFELIGFVMIVLSLFYFYSFDIFALNLITFTCASH